MNVSEIFENQIKIEPKVMSIESLFNNPERVNNTNYKPSYQRNYVWDDEKATYFIESILLGTEIPPLIYFRNSNKVEIVDGRQRYETILRFVNNEFKLKKNGLHKLDNINLANKSFRGIGDKLTEYFWDTKLRIIEFSFHTKNAANFENEEIVKKEIFKRYNSGITPLKPTEIDKAVYFEDDLNSFLKKEIKSDAVLRTDISNLFHFEKSNEEVMLKKVRQLLVQHHIPIRYYAVKKDTIISKYYEHLFSKITDEEVSTYYDGLITKLNLLKLVKTEFNNRQWSYNRLISECLFWAFSIYETETVNSENSVSLSSLGNAFPDIIQELVSYIGENISAFTMERSSFFGVLIARYETISQFFAEKFDIDFSIYIQTSKDFLQQTRAITLQDGEGTSFDELRINKPEPSSIAIVDIVRQMNRQKFLIRPPYQRDEVINTKKSSSIIESILLGIKLPPIFVFKRADQVSEVLDGQQRLLSILGFIKEGYRDENNKLKYSDKNGYSLNLRNSVLTKLTGKKFDQLTQEDQEKIKNFDLWIIEINQKNNVNFEPIDLFVRLNNKPYPIKEDTFEMWNSYISRDTIETIKSIHKNNKGWFYLRKSNTRMEDENIITALIYFEYGLAKKGLDAYYVSKDLDGYKVYNKINFRVRSKNEISRVLEDVFCKDDFISASNSFEFNFIRKLKELVSEPGDSSITTLNKNLDNILGIENGRRTQQSFYFLWCCIYGIPFKVIEEFKSDIKADIKQLYSYMNNITSKASFDNKLINFREKYSHLNVISDQDVYDLVKEISYANLEEIAILFNGKTMHPNDEKHSKEKIPYIKKLKIETYRIDPVEHPLVDVPDNDTNRDYYYKDKIIVRKEVIGERLLVAHTTQSAIFGPGFISVVPNRTGFHANFIISVLSSRLGFFLIEKGQNDLHEISLQSIKSLPIPLIDYPQQLPFIRVFEYLLSFTEKNEMFLFFQRLIDLMIYELFFAEKFRAANCRFLDLLHQLPSISNESKDVQFSIIERIYNELSSPTHEIMASSLKALNIAVVKTIENIESTF